MTTSRILVVLAAIVVASVITLREGETTFNVVASTEAVAVDLSATPLVIELDSVLVFADYDSIPSRFSGTLTLEPGAQVILERISHGPLRLLVRVGEGGGPAGELASADSGARLAIERRAVVRVESPGDRARLGRNLVLPIMGRIELGQEVASHSTRGMLRSAEVALLAHDVVGSGRYEAGRTRLDPGDRFNVEGDYLAVGFLAVDERPAMTVVYRTRGRTAHVTRFAADGYEISAPLRTRLVHDPVIQGLWATVLGILTIYGKLFPAKKKREETAEESKA